MKLVIVLLTLIGLTNSVQAQSESEQKTHAINAIRNVLPDGNYKSRNPFEILKWAETKTYQGRATVRIHKSTGIFQGDISACEMSEYSKEIVKFTRNGNNFEIRVYEHPRSPDVDEPSCTIKFSSGRIIVSDWEQTLSLGFLCQDLAYSNGSEVGRINWVERKLAKDPRPLCSRVDDEDH